MLKLFIAVLLNLFIYPIWAQKREAAIENASIKFDSLSFAAIKNQLNNLPAEDYQKKVYLEKETAIPYRLLTPLAMKKSKKYPLVITLHNSTRIGNDNEKQLEPLSRIWLQPQIRKDFKAYVLAPQFEQRSSDYAVDSTRNILVSQADENLKVLINLIVKIKGELNIDENRIYLIGYSMGGSSVQNLMNLSPDTFAAMVSIAGVPDFSAINALNEKPIWLIHGKNDVENPFHGSKVLCSELIGNKNIRFRIYDHLDHHTINFPLLNSDELPRWLFQWKK